MAKDDRFCITLSLDVKKEGDERKSLQHADIIWNDFSYAGLVALQQVVLDALATIHGMAETVMSEKEYNKAVESVKKPGEGISSG